ncbi:MAG: AAA family ATPase, partial [Olsenella sp.]
MYQRKAYDRLRKWKERSKGSTALLLEGARRVGKSTLAEEFARTEYASYLLIDFSVVSAEVEALFLDHRGDVDSFFMYLLAYYGISLPRRDSLIIFDEVQRFPAARGFLKQLVADGR